MKYENEEFAQVLIRISESLHLSLSQAAEHVLLNIHNFAVLGVPEDEGFLRYCELVLICNGKSLDRTH